MHAPLIPSLLPQSMSPIKVNVVHALLWFKYFFHLSYFMFLYMLSYVHSLLFTFVFHPHLFALSCLKGNYSLCTFITSYFVHCPHQSIRVMAQGKKWMKLSSKWHSQVYFIQAIEVALFHELASTRTLRRQRKGSLFCICFKFCLLALDMENRSLFFHLCECLFCLLGPTRVKESK